ncbi:peptidoglycan DD-metalloendopeptidase family protein [Paraburkholderia dinghuensis]|uniref:peptidoglycan DD-metalloendopeptidase family protein n=1 Tax=Paraburkholderia dinghuensis TaxID=2305225 RepID=UPI001FE56932|nr:peptidoglycan DD-metalloendopeptidase family protein [Paraburkholderia dinghuensis]
MTTRGAACSVAVAAALCGCTFTPWPASSSDAGNTASAPAKQAQPPLLPTGPASAAPDADAPPGYYRVKPGDTLYHIATTRSQRVADVASWNNLPDSGLVQVGQLLRVTPPGADTTSGSAQAQPATAAPTPTAATNHTRSRFVWPMNGGVNTPFVEGKSRGVVIVGAAGQAVKAAAAGRVVYAGNGIKAYGNLVIIKHDTQLITAYGRNSKLLVKEGEAVKQGDVIAQSGTDQAGKASLVFEIREDGKPVNPLPRLPTPRP